MRHAISKFWRNTLSTYCSGIPAGVSSTATTNIVKLHKLSCNDIYWQLLKTPGGSPQVTKWFERYELNVEDWGAICQLPYKCCYETKLQSFQYSIIYRFVPYKDRLYKMGLVDSAICDYCTDIDSIAHRFVFCPGINQFWNDFTSWWSIHDLTLPKLKEEHILLGLFMIDNYSLNKCIMLAKHFIHKQKCTKGNISFGIFKRTLKQNIAMEQYILIKNNKQGLYEERWSHIVGSLS